MLHCSRHSLLATELQQRIKEKFGVSMPVRELFTYPTVSLLSQYIEAMQSNGHDNSQQIVTIGQDLDLSAEVDKHDQAMME